MIYGLPGGNTQAQGYNIMLADITYDGKLSFTAYLILVLMLLIIFGGLGWCLYRAAKAAKMHKANDSEQLPDDV